MSKVDLGISLINRVRKIIYRLSLGLFVILLLQAVIVGDWNLLINYFVFYIPILLFMIPLYDLLIEKPNILKLCLLVILILSSYFFMVERLITMGNLYDYTFKFFLVYPVLISYYGVAGILNGKVYSGFNRHNKKSELYAYNIITILVGLLIYVFTGNVFK